MKTMKKGGEKKVKKTWIIVTVILVVSAGLVAIFLNNVSGSTKPIKEVADQFQPPSEWKLDYERVTPPRFVCLDGGSCPEVSRTWIVDSITIANITRILRQTDWNYSFEELCSTFDQDFSKVRYPYSCTVNGHKDNYNIRIYIAPSDPNNNSSQPKVSLSIRPK